MFACTEAEAEDGQSIGPQEAVMGLGTGLLEAVAVIDQDLKAVTDQEEAVVGEEVHIDRLGEVAGSGDMADYVSIGDMVPAPIEIPYDINGAHDLDRLTHEVYSGYTYSVQDVIKKTMSFHVKQACDLENANREILILQTKVETMEKLFKDLVGEERYKGMNGMDEHEAEKMAKD
ncbi:MAG: hypothetical protein AAGM67_08510 [Bacteroidota bacterium]